MNGPAWRCAGLLALAPLGLAASAEAQANDAGKVSQRESARRLGSQGLQAYDQGAYEIAVETLSEAIAFHDAPTLRLYRARASGRLGRWVAACRDYDFILGSNASESESAVTLEARAAAELESADAHRRPAQLKLAYTGIAPRSVRMDGIEWPAAQFGTARQIDPGEHVLEVERPGTEPLRIRSSFGQGETLTFSLDELRLLRHATAPDSPAPPRTPEPVPAARPDPSPAVTNVDHPAPTEHTRAAPPAEVFRLELSMFGWIDKSRRYDTDDPSLGDTRSDGNITRVAATLFPLSGEWRDWLGITASWETAYRERLHRELLAGLRVRHASGPVEFGFQLAAGTLQSGRLDTPALSYSLVQPSLDVRWRSGGFSLSGSLALALPFDYGTQAEAQYPDITGYGVVAGLGMEYRIWRSVGVQLSALLRRFYLEPAVLEITQTSGLLPLIEPSYAVSILDVDTSWCFGVIIQL